MWCFMAISDIFFGEFSNRYSGTSKYDLIKNHTARRSFCTNAYIAGMSTLDIMAISGHSSEKTFLNYIKISADERAVKIAENPFFQ